MSSAYDDDDDDGFVRDWRASARYCQIWDKITPDSASSGERTFLHCK